jgi:hypothetical protein
MNGGIGIVLEFISHETVREYLVESYCMVTPKKLQAVLDARE